MELKKRILHLWSWKFFFPWSKWSIFACHLKKRWRQNDEVLINSGKKNVDLHGVQTEIPATILFSLDIGPTETHIFLLKYWSKLIKTRIPEPPACRLWPSHLILHLNSIAAYFSLALNNFSLICAGFNLKI